MNAFLSFMSSDLPVFDQQIISLKSRLYIYQIKLQFCQISILIVVVVLTKRAIDKFLYGICAHKMDISM